MNVSDYDITIAVPTYNRDRYIKRALDSIFAQEDARIEVLVLDNASTDNTSTVLEEYQGRPNFRYYRNPFNLGPVGNYNRCLEYARGEYFMILGDDDYLSSNYCKTLLATIGGTDSIFLGKCVAITSEGKILHESSSVPSQMGGVQFVEKVACRDPGIARHAWFMFACKTATLRSFEGFPATEAAAFSDNLIIIKMAFGRQVFINPQAINYYAVYPESYGNRNVYSVAVASMQAIRYWDQQIAPEFEEARVDRGTRRRIRNQFIVSLVRTYVGRAVKYGPKSFRGKIVTLTLFPYKSWYFKLFASLFKERFISPIFGKRNQVSK